MRESAYVQKGDRSEFDWHCLDEMLPYCIDSSDFIKKKVFLPMAVLESLSYDGCSTPLPASSSATLFHPATVLHHPVGGNGTHMVNENTKFTQNSEGAFADETHDLEAQSSSLGDEIFCDCNRF